MQRKTPPPGHVNLHDIKESRDAEWAAPFPLVGQFERVAYPVAALPLSIRAAVEEVQAAVQAPVEMVASSALATISVATQHLANVRRNRALPGPTSLYVLTIAESGDRKSTVDRLMGGAVRAFQDEQRDAAKSALNNHAASVEAWQAEREASAARMHGDAKGGKNLDTHRADLAELEARKPEPPRVPRLLYQDVTSEKLSKALATDWPSAGVFSSEGGAVLGGHSMGRDALTRNLALFNTLWDGGTHEVDRATGPSFSVRGARLTVSLQVQPTVLADFLERDRGLSRGSGFLARFLIAQPASLQGRRFYSEPGEMPALETFSGRIAELLSELPNINGDRGMVLPILDFSPEAKAAWIDAYNGIERQLATDGDFASIRDGASKGGDNIARLAAVLHVYENGPHGSIGITSVESATAIVLWHLYSAKAALAPFTMSKEAAAAAMLDGWLIDRCRSEETDGFPTRYVLNSGPHRVRDRESFDKAMEVLTRHNRARVVEDGKRRTIKVNPSLIDGTASFEDGDADPDATPPTKAVGWN